MNFAKLFQVSETEQVLVQLTFEESQEGASDKVIQSTDYAGIRFDMALGFKAEEKAQECFDEYTEQQAREFHKQCVDLILEVSKDEVEH